MASGLTFNEYTATGVTTAGSSLGTDFPVPFSYLAKSHVNADFNKILQSQASFVVYGPGEAVSPASPFGSSQAFLRFTSNFPTAGTTVRIRRITEKSIPLVDFQDGSALIAEDQDLAFLQNFYLNQENVEQADNALGKVGLVYFAGGTRITEVGQPTSANDATTKTYVDTNDALKVTKAGDSMSGALAMGNNKITGLGTPTAAADATTKAYVDAGDASLNTAKVAKAGDTMSGALAMGTNKITGLGTPTASTDASTKGYVDTNDALKVSKAGDLMTGILDMNFNRITEVGTPTDSADAATKAYADTKLSLSGGSLTGQVDLGGFVLANAGTPVLFTDAATKQYVDSAIQQYVTTGGASGNPTRWQFTGDGSTLVFNITGATAIYTNSYLVAIDGVVQDPTFSYDVAITIGSQTLTFDQAPPSGTRIVVIALGYALPTISAIPNNTVSTASIVDDAVTSAKLRDDATTDANRAVTTNHIRDLSVTTGKIVGNAVTDAKLSSDATTDANRAVSTNHIKDLAVTTGKLAGNAVTDAKLSSSTTTDASRAVTTNHIRDSAVTNAKIAGNAVTDAKLSSDASLDANRAVNTNHIKDLAVTNAKLAGSIDSSKLANSGVSAGTYGSTTQTSQVTINAQGLVTSASNQSIAFPTQRIVNIYSVNKNNTFSNPNGWRYMSIPGLEIGTLNTAPYTGGRITLASASNKVLILGTVHVGDQNGYVGGLQLMRWQNGTTPIAATAMVAGNYYMIVTLGTTTFTSFGAQANVLGVYFRASAVGTGTGTVLPVTMVGMGLQDSTRTRVTVGYSINVNAYNMVNVSINLWDTPGYTAVCYDLLVGAYGTGASYINRSHNWQVGAGSGSTSTAYEYCPSSNLTFIETIP